MTAADRVVLVGCGILRREVLSLVEQNDWPVDTCFLDSALHCELDKLSAALERALRKYDGREIIVFYGCCHPLMDRMIAPASALRTEGQNCVDMLLGNERFSRELADGAFFLLQDWASRWEHIVTKSFGTRDAGIIRQIFSVDRTYMLGVRTPCSDDFTADAERAAALAGLPLRWTDVTLEHLEAVLRQAIVLQRGEGDA